MHVVLRGITIWTLYTLVACVSVACRSTAGRVRWELVFGPMPDELYEHRLDDDGQQPPPPPPPRTDRRLQRRNSDGGVDPHHLEVAVHQSDVAIAAASAAAAAGAGMCDCTLSTGILHLEEDRYYPNQLLSVKCKVCQWCREVVYPVRVLTKLTRKYSVWDLQQDEMAAYSQDNLPQELTDNNWWFVQVNVTAACSCPNY